MLKKLFKKKKKEFPLVKPAQLENDKELSFEDVNLEVYFRNITGKREGKILLSDIYNVKVLDFKGWPLLSIRGIQNAVNLEELILYGSKMNNITFLSYLKKLRKLDISWSDSISEIKSLKDLSELEDLTLVFSPKISNFEYVTNLPKLKKLNLSEDSIFNIEFIGRTENLEELALSKNRIKDIEPISKLKGLKKLDISANEIVDPSALRGLDLEYLDISANKIENISFLENVNNLKYLDIRGNGLDKKMINKKIISKLKKNRCKLKI